MKKAILLFIAFGMFFNLKAQVKFEKAAKQYSFETGYQYNFKSNFISWPDQGYSFLLDYAWKLSGYNKKKAVYLSVPLGYTYFPSSDESSFQSFSILNYGWTVRHELLRDKKIIPFVGYALLLNQLRINNVEGSVFGHQTKFELGANYYLKERLVLFLKAEYSLRRFAALGESISNKIQSAELKFGVRF